MVFVENKSPPSFATAGLVDFLLLATFAVNVLGSVDTTLRFPSACCWCCCCGSGCVSTLAGGCSTVNSAFFTSHAVFVTSGSASSAFSCATSVGLGALCWLCFFLRCFLALPASLFATEIALSFAGDAWRASESVLLVLVEAGMTAELTIFLVDGGTLFLVAFPWLLLLLPDVGLSPMKRRRLSMSSSPRNPAQQKQ